MNDFFISNKLISSCIIIAILYIARWLIIRYLRRQVTSGNEKPKRLINSVNNITNLLVAISLILIWLSELRFVALSIATFIVAIVIATREYIQCFLGSLFLASSRNFGIGDWIKIENYCGEVVRSDWLSTTLLEVDLSTKTYRYTGRTLVLPNNIFVANTIINLNFMRRYISHTFTLVREADKVDLFQFREPVLNKANELCESFRDVAERYNGLIEKRMDTEIEGPDASVRITTTEIGKNAITITIFCPTDQAISIEQKITAYFMDCWYQALKNSQAADSV